MMTSSLPKGWRFVKFGDVVDNMNETTRDPDSIGIDRVVGLEHMDPESLPLKRWDNLLDLHEGTSFTRVFRAGQVLFGKRRAYQRKVSFPDFDGICSGDILVFQPKNAELLPEFLPFLVQSDGFFDHALGTSAGSLSPRTKWQELAKYEFALPPIAEQQSKIRLISAIDDALSAYQSASFEWVIQALLKKTLADGSISKTESALGNVLSLLTDGSHFSPRTVDEGYPYVTVRNLSEGKIDLEGCAKISENDFQDLRKNGCEPLVGDVLFSKDGTIGRVAQVTADSQFVVLSSLAILRPNPKLISSDYLTIILTSNEFQSAATRSKTGLAIKRVVLKTLRNLPICVPSLSDQKKIVDLISEVRDVEAKCRKAMGDLMVLRRRLIEDFNQLGL
jgi:type I restriction enzyme S subunit